MCFYNDWKFFNSEYRKYGSLQGYVDIGVLSYNLLDFLGLQPLCGTGVTSCTDTICRPPPSRPLMDGCIYTIE